MIIRALKRKRSATECSSPTTEHEEKRPRRVSTPGQPLTRRNLQKLEGPTARAPQQEETQRKRKNTSNTSTLATDEDASTSLSSTSKTHDTGSVEDETLQAWRLFHSRNKAKPPELEQFLNNTILPLRDRPITSNSLEVVCIWQDIITYLEPTTLNIGANPLFYQGEPAKDGKENILRDLDRLWRKGCVPKPNGKTVDDTILENAMESVGSVKTPKPDLTLGYTRSAFSTREHEMIKSLDNSASARVLVLDQAPFFPYQIVEWELSTANAAQGLCQARRDGAAAVASMHNFFKAAGIADPSPVDTCVFSATVTHEVVTLRVHWRRVDEDGVISFEADLLLSALCTHPGLVFDLRSVILNILAWAQDRRLRRIKHALKIYSEGFERETSYVF